MKSDTHVVALGPALLRSIIVREAHVHRVGDAQVRVEALRRWKKILRRAEMPLAVRTTDSRQKRRSKTQRNGRAPDHVRAVAVALEEVGQRHLVLRQAGLGGAREDALSAAL